MIGIKRLFAMAALPAAAAMPAGAEIYREFGDVSVYCGNAVTCEIQFEGGGGDIYALGFSRKAGPDAPLGFFLGVEELDADASVALSVDGRPLITLPGGAFEAEAWRSRFMHEDGDVPDLLAAMRDGRALAVALSGGEPEAFSLAGLVAALIFVDETQGRVGARDALEKKGSGESEPAVAREIEAIAELPPAIRLDFEDGALCSFDDEERFRWGDPVEVMLEGGNSLYALPCGGAGAYNQIHSLYFVTAERTFPAAFPVMTEEGPSVTDMVWNIVWDHRTLTLTAFFRGRGLGDCGAWDKWVLRNPGGVPAFVLLESRAKEECDEDYMGGPQNWPATWPPPAR